MDKLKKFELMEKIVHELEDLKNSQQAILVKLAKIEVDNIELSNKRLEKDLPDMLDIPGDLTRVFRALWTNTLCKRSRRLQLMINKLIWSKSNGINCLLFRNE